MHMFRHYYFGLQGAHNCHFQYCLVVVECYRCFVFVSRDVSSFNAQALLGIGLHVSYTGWS